MKITNAERITRMKYTYIDEISQDFQQAFGRLATGFRIIAWGNSGNGKTNLALRFAAEILKFDNVLYISIEESRGPTIKSLIDRYIPDEGLRKKLKVAYTAISFENLCAYLQKPRTPKYIFIDSLQYLNMNHWQYKEMVAAFPKKNFFFLSHAKGNLPDGKTALKVMYDAGVKVKVEGDIAFVKHSRYGGSTNFVIYEAGAKKYWGKKFKQASENRKFTK